MHTALIALTVTQPFLLIFKYYSIKLIKKKHLYNLIFKLKNQLIKIGIKDHKCENCELIEWMGKQIPLELHHVNGNRFDNRIENIQLLCPNCHALTDNYRGKNMSAR